MTDLLTGSVMQGLVGANSSMKISKFTYGIGAVAQTKGDYSVMKRAYGFSGVYGREAMTNLENAHAELAEKTKEAREQKKAEEAEKLEAIREEAAEQRREETQANSGVSNKTDTIQISSEAASSMQKAQTGDTVLAETNTERPNVRRKERPTTVPNTYTARGKISVGSSKGNAASSVVNVKV